MKSPDNLWLILSKLLYYWHLFSLIQSSHKELNPREIWIQSPLFQNQQTRKCWTRCFLAGKTLTQNISSLFVESIIFQFSHSYCWPQLFQNQCIFASNRDITMARNIWHQIILAIRDWLGDQRLDYYMVNTLDINLARWKKHLLCIHDLTAVRLHNKLFQIYL